MVQEFLMIIDGANKTSYSDKELLAFSRLVILNKVHSLLLLAMDWNITHFIIT